MSRDRYVPPAPTLEAIARGLSIPAKDLRVIVENYRRETQRHTAHEQVQRDYLRWLKRCFERETEH